jgi:hypothetical protein
VLDIQKDVERVLLANGNVLRSICGKALINQLVMLLQFGNAPLEI